jgi:hypothetical protein
MASTLTALISTSPETLRREVRPQVRVVDLPQGLALIPLTHDVRGTLLPQDEPACDDVSYLTPALAALARDWSRMVPVAYVEGETHGGTGTQIAVIWKGGDLLWGPRYTTNNAVDVDDHFVLAPDASQYAINLALRELGVDATGHHDEYAALGLHLKRRTGDWLS